MKKVLLAVLLVLSVSTNVLCEPDKTVRFLMNEPVSLLDMGLYKLEQRLFGYERDRHIRQSINKFFAATIPPIKTIVYRVDYDFPSNTILLIVKLIFNDSPQSPSEDSLRKFISYIMTTIKVEFYANYIDCFNHNGYIKNKQVQLEKITDIVKLSVEILYDRGLDAKGADKTPKRKYAESMLKDKIILYGE